MIGVFASFTTGDDIVVKSIAFALAFGVMVDAFLVRMTLVPVILADRASRSIERMASCDGGTSGALEALAPSRYCGEQRAASGKTARRSHVHSGHPSARPAVSGMG